jgi:hypothetical protein
MRRFWIRNPRTDDRWDLTPSDPASIEGGCLIAKVNGLGYESNLKQTQAGTDYFITEVISKNIPIQAYMYFRNATHIDNFRKFMGTLNTQMELHYSPDGEIIASDLINETWYKNFVITSFSKGEKDAYGWIEVSVTLTPQSDIWRKNTLVATNNPGYVGEPLYYPYFYPLQYGGRNVLAVDLTVNGMDTGCLIRITNNTGNIISNLEWINEYHYTDRYGTDQVEYQRARFNVLVRNGQILEVDSDGVKQRSELRDANGLLQNVANFQEPDYKYINFVQLKSGNNRLIFLVDVEGIEITVGYTEKREVV